MKSDLTTPETTAIMIAVEPAELSDVNSRSPEWERARALLAGVFNAARQSVAGQVLLGRELLHLKRDLGFEGSGRRKPSRDGFNSWNDYTQAELGIAESTANRCINSYKVIRHRGEASLGDDAKEFQLLIAPPASLSEEDRKRLQKAVGALIKGDDSQRSLLREFRLLSASGLRPGGDTSASKKNDPKTNIPADVKASVLFRSLHGDMEKVLVDFRNLPRVEIKDKLGVAIFPLPLVTEDAGKIVGLLDYQEAFERQRGEIEEGLKDLSDKIAVTIKFHMQGDPPKRDRKKSTNTKSKR